MEDKKIMEEKKAKAAAAAVAVAMEEEEEVFLPGYRFHPTDEELLSFYLRRKVRRKAFSIDLIREIDIYKHDPWDLPKVSCGEKEWYFFCLRGRKYRNSIRPNRVTGSGFWKATGIDRSIYGGGTGDACIGLKKSLVYYRGSAGKGTKTDWMMHEFRLPPLSNNNNDDEQSTLQNHQAEIWTICRIFKRATSCKKSESPAKFSKKTDLAVPSDSSSKACSFESDQAAASSTCLHEENKSVSRDNHNYYCSYDDENKSDDNPHEINNGGQYLWNSYSFEQLAPAPAPAPATTGCEVNDWFNDGDWGEIELLVELMNDQSVAYQNQYQY